MTPEILHTIKYERRWTLKCLAILAFHNYYCEQSGNKRGEKWTVERSSVYLNLSIGYISESIKLAKALIKMPELERLTREKALEVLRGKE